MSSSSTSQPNTCINYILYPISPPLSFLNCTLMTPMITPPLPPESVHWVSFNENEVLAIIMKAQNYINDELIRSCLRKCMMCRDNRSTARTRVAKAERNAATAVWTPEPAI